MIAIIDDDADVRDALFLLFAAMGVAAEQFASAAAFLADTPANFTRLILDHHMPEMTGLELAERLRASGVMTPIMLVSGNLTPHIVRRARSLGVDPIIEKPADLQLILAFVEGGGPALATD